MAAKNQSEASFNFNSILSFFTQHRVGAGDQKLGRHFVVTGQRLGEHWVVFVVTMMIIKMVIMMVSSFLRPELINEQKMARESPCFPRRRHFGFNPLFSFQAMAQDIRAQCLVG